MHNFFVLILFFLCFLMFVVSRPIKMGLLLLAGICIYEYHFNFGTGVFSDVGQCVKVLPLCFFISEFSSFYRFFRKDHYFILLSILFLGSLYVVYTIYVSPHMGTGIKFFVISIICRYLLPCFAFVCLKNVNDIRKVYQCVFIGVLIMTFFGIINLVFHHSIYVDWLFQGETVADYMSDMGSKFSHSERFRVQATFSNPFDYGYSCLAILLLFWYGHIKKYISLRQLIIVAGCTLFGILFCNCRTILLCAIVFVMFFSLFAYKNQKYLGLLPILLAVLVVAINLIPFLGDRITFLSTMFDANSKTMAGSSFNMRSIQLAAVFSYIEGHEFTGCGLGFFARDIGFAKGGVNVVDYDLGGLEGSYLLTLLETGYIGTVLYFGIIILILMWARKKISKVRVSAIFLISLFSLFLLYGILTGELRSAYITFLISGIAILDIRKFEKKNEADLCKKKKTLNA